MVIGRPPAGLQFIDLRIHGTSSDGVVSDTIRIDLHTGAILDHVRDQRTELGTGLFSNNLLAASDLMSNEDVSVLSRALEQWRELPDRS